VKRYANRRAKLKTHVASRRDGDPPARSGSANGGRSETRSAVPICSAIGAATRGPPSRNWASNAAAGRLKRRLCRVDLRRSGSSQPPAQRGEPTNATPAPSSTQRCGSTCGSYRSRRLAHGAHAQEWRPHAGLPGNILSHQSTRGSPCETGDVMYVLITLVQARALSRLGVLVRLVLSSGGLKVMSAAATVGNSRRT
jgi:hypothetical protein